MTQTLRRAAIIAIIIGYPFALKLYHGSYQSGTATGFGLAFLWLLAACLVPLAGLWAARAEGYASRTGRLDLTTRRLAYAAVAAPPFYVLFGTVMIIAGNPVADELGWAGLWLLIGALLMWRKSAAAEGLAEPGTRLRVSHGAIAALLAIYILFHLTNHMFGLGGPEAHKAVMDKGRLVYRSAVGQPILVLLMLTQVVIGARLAWRWSAIASDGYRNFQVASGVYMLGFILVHMNSVFLARAALGIDTGWGFATGAPTGLLGDAWNIRLVPHYLFGVFFILAHLASGLRVVALAHGINERPANGLWRAALIVSAAIAAAILAGMCGVRIA